MRSFAAEPLNDRDLGLLLSILAGSSRRPNPAAGGINTVRAITLSWSTDHGTGRVIQHDPTAHTLTTMGPCPAWADLVDDLGGAEALTPPAALIGLFSDTRTLLATYGERGGRFALLEAGAALQNLTLAAASLGLVGYPIGGATDARMQHLAGPDSTVNGGVRYVVGYAVGYPVRETP